MESQFFVKLNPSGTPRAHHSASYRTAQIRSSEPSGIDQIRSSDTSGTPEATHKIPQAISGTDITVVSDAYETARTVASG
jgi:hypothetical protein